MHTRLAPALALAASLVGCDRFRGREPEHPMQYGVAESPTQRADHAPWVEPAERAMRGEWDEAKRAFLAGFPDPIGLRYARCDRSVGWLVTIPGGVMLLDWSGRLVPCQDPRETDAPMPGARFDLVVREGALRSDLPRTNVLTRALILRTNVGAESVHARTIEPSATEAWAVEAWRVALAHFVGDIEGASRERARFFLAASRAAIGAYERRFGSTSRSQQLWFAPIAAALAAQLDDRAQTDDDAPAESAQPGEEAMDAGATDTASDAGDAAMADASAQEQRGRVFVQVLFRRRRASAARLRERLAETTAPAVSWLTSDAIERVGDPAIIEPLLSAIERDERFVSIRVIPSEHPERERPARAYELAYAALATTVAFDPIFEQLGADRVVRPRTDAAQRHARFVSGDRATRAELVAQFRARLGPAPLTRAQLARWQLASDSLQSIAAAAAKRLPRAPARMPNDGARRVALEDQMRSDAALLVQRADALFAEDQASSCQVLAEVERVSPGYQSEPYRAMIERFAVHTTLSGEALGCVGRVLQPRPHEEPAVIEQRYAQWIERVGPELYSASPCETLGITATRTASAAVVREQAITALEALRTERTAGGLMRALVRWVRPEAIRCAAQNPAYRDWVRAVLARGVPLGYSLTNALRDGEPWGRRRRCPVVNDGYARIENRIALRDLAGVAFGFADTREPCAVAAQAPRLDAMRFSLEAAVRQRAEETQAE
jgi:hypothetical protein